MTLDVKALRARAEAGWDETLTAEQLLALLGRLERAEKVEERAAEACDVGMDLLVRMDQAGLIAFGLSRDDLEDRLRALREVLPDDDRAALDDEAPR